MSKKDKSKFKKRLREQILKNVQQNPSVTQPTVLTSIESNQVPPQPLIQNNRITNIQSLPITATSSTDPTLTLVKKDLKKSAVIIGSIIIVILAIYFINQKYNILIPFGNQIFKVLNIQA